MTAYDELRKATDNTVENLQHTLRNYADKLPLGNRAGVQEAVRLLQLLLADLDAARVDAERYQWLRIRGAVFDGDPLLERGLIHRIGNLDAAIDKLKGK